MNIKYISSSTILLTTMEYCPHLTYKLIRQMYIQGKCNTLLLPSLALHQIGNIQRLRT